MVKTSVCVRYKCVDDWHVFQSEDVPGLYVASRDAQQAFEDVAPSIELLLKLNEGVECKAVAEIPFDHFIESLREHDSVDVHVPVMSDKRFVLTGVPA